MGGTRQSKYVLELGQLDELLWVGTKKRNNMWIVGAGKWHFTQALLCVHFVGRVSVRLTGQEQTKMRLLWYFNNCQLYLIASFLTAWLQLWYSTGNAARFSRRQDRQIGTLPVPLILFSSYPEWCCVGLYGWAKMLKNDAWLCSRKPPFSIHVHGRPPSSPFPKLQAFPLLERPGSE